ncbi:MAG: hypothetical protein ACJAVI_000026 [Candidatus Azotimanducaceae bacterium]|jgi:hypothetical protein
MRRWSELFASPAFKAKITHKDRSLIDIEQVVSFIRDETGNPIGILSVSRDKSPRNRFERELETVFLSTQ